MCLSHIESRASEWIILIWVHVKPTKIHCVGQCVCLSVCFTLCCHQWGKRSIYEYACICYVKVAHLKVASLVEGVRRAENRHFPFEQWLIVDQLDTKSFESFLLHTLQLQAQCAHGRACWQWVRHFPWFSSSFSIAPKIRTNCTSLHCMYERPLKASLLEHHQSRHGAEHHKSNDENFKTKRFLDGF